MNPCIFILEDNEGFAHSLIQAIEAYPVKLDYVLTGDFETARQKIISPFRYSAFFIDISLDDKTENTDGLAFAEYLSTNTQHKDTPIIFTTGFPNYVYEALNRLHCYAYLLKPFQQNDVFYQLDQIFQTNYFIRLKTTDGIYMKLNTDDIYYIRAYGRNMLFTTCSGEISSRQYTMKSLQSLLPDCFERCHRSFLVNTKYIESVNPKLKTLRLMKIDEDVPYGKDFQLH